MLLIAEVRAAWWAARSIHRARRTSLRSAPPTSLPRVPAVPAGAKRGVSLSLRLSRSTCLVRAVVLQAWYLAQGEERDLVIGVTVPSRGFAAHAWLDGDPPCHTERFHELTRRAARP